MGADASVRLDPPLRALKRACGEALHAAGKQDFVAGELGCKQERISVWGSQTTAAFLPLQHVAHVEALGRDAPGWPHVTRYLARQTGHALVRLPVAEAESSADLHACAAAHAKEANDVTTRILAAASRGRITGAAVRDLGLARECREAMEALAQLAAAIEAIERSDSS